MGLETLSRKCYVIARNPLLTTCLFLALPELLLNISFAQASPQPGVMEQIRQLSESMTKAQHQIENSQLQLNEMREQLVALMQQAKQDNALVGYSESKPADEAVSRLSSEDPATALDAAVKSLQESQAIQSSQISTFIVRRVLHFNQRIVQDVKVSGIGDIIGSRDR